MDKCEDTGHRATLNAVLAAAQAFRDVVARQDDAARAAHAAVQVVARLGCQNKQTTPRRSSMHIDERGSVVRCVVLWVRQTRACVFDRRNAIFFLIYIYIYFNPRTRNRAGRGREAGGGQGAGVSAARQARVAGGGAGRQAQGRQQGASATGARRLKRHKDGNVCFHVYGCALVRGVGRL